MGLDMYLYKKTYVGNKWKEGDELVQVEGGQVNHIKTKRVQEITEMVMYWRKANAIHNWFVTHVQEGEDDCKEYYVDREQLEDLVETIDQVLQASELKPAKIQVGTEFSDGKRKPIMEDGGLIKDPTVAKNLLPSTEGFFFGGTEYDNYYLDSLKRTSKELKDLLNETRPDQWDISYYYRASW